MKTIYIITIALIVWLLLAQSCFTFKITDKAALKKFNIAGLSLKLNSIKAGDRTLHFAQTGNDTLPTIIFVHGTPGSWIAFEEYLKDTALLKKFRLISIDRPGFGNSNFGDALNLSSQSLVISPLFKHIQNNQPVYLVGHSLGGPMICRLAIDNPGAVNGLVILAGSQDPAAEKPEIWRPIIFKTPLNYFVPGSWQPSNEELWYLKKDLVNLKTGLFKITCPVYILHGTKLRLKAKVVKYK